MMSDDEYAQEYECSFDAAVRGAYFGKEMGKPRQSGSPPFHTIRRLQVHTAWDLGMADSTVIWFFQSIGREFARNRCPEG
jgi:phage terminase large subunit